MFIESWYTGNITYRYKIHGQATLITFFTKIFNFCLLQDTITPGLVDSTFTEEVKARIVQRHNELRAGEGARNMLRLVISPLHCTLGGLH